MAIEYTPRARRTVSRTAGPTLRLRSGQAGGRASVKKLKKAAKKKVPAGAFAKYRGIGIPVWPSGRKAILRKIRELRGRRWWLRARGLATGPNGGRVCRVFRIAAIWVGRPSPTKGNPEVKNAGRQPFP